MDLEPNRRNSSHPGTGLSTGIIAWACQVCYGAAVQTDGPCCVTLTLMKDANCERKTDMPATATRNIIATDTGHYELLLLLPRPMHAPRSSQIAGGERPHSGRRHLSALVTRLAMSSQAVRGAWGLSFSGEYDGREDDGSAATCCPRDECPCLGQG